MQIQAVKQATTGRFTSIEVREIFESLFGKCEGVYRAPGRVNLIGEHTDYNDGFVMPVAIGFYTYVAAARRSDRKLAIYSVDYQQTREFLLDEIRVETTGHWSDYVRGVAGVLQSRGIRLPGASLVIKGEVPIGAGLSSSASLEVACALALLAVSGVTLDPMELALACQQAEHQYGGTRCGIMDQFIANYGKSGHAVMLDCRSLDHQLVKLNGHAQIVICNTKVKHNLAKGEYNLRRQDCEAGVRHLQRHLPEIKALRDVTMAQLESHGGDLPEVTFRRCRHVIGENLRVQLAVEALNAGDLERFGVLMRESHNSLRGDYDVSCKELDTMVEIGSGIEGVYGARMTGGGFGGCTVNLVSSGSVEHFREIITREYERTTGIAPDVYVCEAAQGAGPAPEER